MVKAAGPKHFCFNFRIVWIWIGSLFDLGITKFTHRECSNIISLYFGPLRIPPPYLKPFSCFGSTPPPFSCMRIHIATELASHFTVFCRIFSRYQYKKHILSMRIFLTHGSDPSPCLTPFSHLCKVWPGLYQAGSRAPRILPPLPRLPPWVRSCTCGPPPPSGEWYDNFKKW